VVSRGKSVVRKWVVGGAAVAVSLVSAGAPAAAAAPTDVWAVFAQCPVHTGGVEGCIYAPVEGGYLALGETVVPVAKTFVLQGGFLEGGEGESAHPLAAALDGETLTKVGLVIPGGLFGRPLDAVTELAAPASSILLLFEEPRTIVLPIKVRLVSPLLGAECSIGSNSHPIVLSLTTGTSGRLTGNAGKNTSTGYGRILVVRGFSGVSSGFAVPKASGCGSALVDEAIDAKLGLPLSKGTAAVFDMTFEQASASAVEEESEG
jgi:hypothetical protein